ncbi:MAG: type I asparaginase [Bacteroidetes bacterium]|nr:type I asparaginase [Bacteroidota bacterium]
MKKLAQSIKDKRKPSVLLVYTGGTIGMIEDPKTGQLKPFDFRNLTTQIPELSKFNITLTPVSFEKPIDSSNMHPDVWVMLCKLIEKNYEKYDGFVILHGSDTMAYTASALSFMLENIAKPVILTGSQLPIGIIRTDGKENLITAIEIASSQKDGLPIVSEVCIYFEYQLYRGNRTNKFNAEHFQAFQSPNYPILAEAGVHIKYSTAYLQKPSNKPLRIHYKLDANIAILKLFPGITQSVVNAILSSKGLKAVVLETFGAGNAPTDAWFVKELKEAIDKGIIIYNVTQCSAGSVELGRYETSAQLKEIGVLSAFDSTTEAAVTKLMHLLANYNSKSEIKKLLEKSIRGELTEKWN